MSAFHHFDSLITKIQNDEPDWPANMPMTKEEFAAQIDQEIADCEQAEIDDPWEL